MKRMYLMPAWMFASVSVMSPTFISLPVAGIDLHDPDGAHRAFCILVELRLLVALRAHQQPVHVVLVAVFLEVLDQGQELLALLLGSRILHVFDVLQVARQELVAGRGPDLVAGGEIVQRRLELRAAFADRPRDFAAGANRDVIVHGELAGKSASRSPPCACRR